MGNLWSYLKGGKKSGGGAQRGTGGGDMSDADERGFWAGELVFVSSSNVAAVQYHAEIQSLMIEYADGVAWLYSPISKDIAASFLAAGSKGGWTWDWLKIRGPGNQGKHQPGITAVKIKG